MPDPKPCPCGHDMKTEAFAGIVYVTCTRPGCLMGFVCPGERLHEYMDSWNTRAPAPPSEGIRKVIAAAARWKRTPKSRVLEAELAMVDALLALTAAEREACGVAM